MTPHPAIPLTAAIVGTLGGCVLGWRLRGSAGPIGSARKRPAGAVRTAPPKPVTFLGIPVTEMTNEQYAAAGRFVTGGGRIDPRLPL